MDEVEYKHRLTVGVIMFVTPLVTAVVVVVSASECIIVQHVVNL